jgi:hypothetical protein
MQSVPGRRLKGALAMRQCGLSPEKTKASLLPTTRSASLPSLFEAGFIAKIASALIPALYNVSARRYNQPARAQRAFLPRPRGYLQ